MRETVVAATLVALALIAMHGYSSYSGRLLGKQAPLPAVTSVTAGDHDEE